jgi:hypothetical protein
MSHQNTPSPLPAISDDFRAAVREVEESEGAPIEIESGVEKNWSAQATVRVRLSGDKAPGVGEEAPGVQCSIGGVGPQGEAGEQQSGPQGEAERRSHQPDLQHRRLLQRVPGGGAAKSGSQSS